jgi:uncharacterized membrane protein
MGTVMMLVFPSRGMLIDAVDKLHTLDYVNIQNSAVIAKAADGETLVMEDDISAVEGSITGGTLGSLMTALGVAQMGAFLLPGVGPIIAIGAGALLGGLIGGTTGGVTAGLIDFGFKNQQLEDLSARLENGHTALVLEVDSTTDVVERIKADMSAYSVDIIQAPVV